MTSGFPLRQAIPRSTRSSRVQKHEEARGGVPYDPGGVDVAGWSESAHLPAELNHADERFSRKRRPVDDDNDKSSIRFSLTCESIAFSLSLSFSLFSDERTIPRGVSDKHLRLQLISSHETLRHVVDATR